MLVTDSNAPIDYGAYPDWLAEVLAENRAIKAAQRAAELLAPSQPHTGTQTSTAAAA